MSLWDNMNRDFRHLNIYLNKLVSDVYPAPVDEQHTEWALQMFNLWFAKNKEVKSVLDAGCGDTAFMKPHFEKIGAEYTGVALNSDNPNVQNVDFTFLPFEDDSFDLVWSRHSLEHSPMPIITLMEWYRVSKAWLCLVLPNPVTYGWAGLNHYSVMHPTQVEFLLKRVGWNVIWSDFSEPSELRYMCEKVRKTEYEKATT